MKIKLLIILILTINSLSSRAQMFPDDQYPPRLKFRQINTVNFQIIYPREMEVEAQRMANTLEHILPRVAKTLKKHPKKISVILQNQGIESNGFVQLAPRRSEFFTTPLQSSDYQDWLNSLAVHELRHVVQFDKLTGYLKRPFFEELALAIFGITLPPWFYEGDAVGIETAITEAGRGRLPSWDIQFRTNTLSDRNYSYTKNFMGSVKDVTPGYYQLGYFMTSKLRRDFGSHILDSLYERIRKRPFQPYSLSRSIRHFTGMTTSQLHDSTAAELKRLWQEQSEKINHKSYPVLNERKSRFPVDYLLPIAISKSEILVLKQGREMTAELTLIDTSGREERVVRIGYQKEPHFHSAAGKIVWDEIRFEGRFHKRSYNVINLLDLRSGKRRQLTHKTRLFSPTLSPDGKIIAAIAISYTNQISLVELDAETGKELKRYASPANAFLQTPSFNETGSKIIMSAVTSAGSTLVELNRKDQTFTHLLSWQRQQIARPIYAGEKIIFKAHYNGIDNLYFLTSGTTEPRQMTFVKFGAFNPSFNPFTGKVLFNSYQQKGFDVCATTVDSTGNDLEQESFIDYAAPLVNQEGAGNVFENIPNRHFSSGKYRDIKNLFYFHSASIAVEDNAYFNDYNVSLALKSNNKLNTLDFSAGYEYNNALRGSEYFASLSYKKYMPVVRLSYHNQPRLLYQRTQTPGGVTLTPITWRENITEANASIPLAINRFNNVYNLSVGIGTSYTSRYSVVNRPRTFIDQLEFPVRYTLNLSRNSTRSAMDLAPRFGQNLNLSYRHFPLDENFSGHLFTLRSRAYFPGFFKNHSFQAAFNYQSNSGTYSASTDIPHIRGYSYLRPTADLRNNLLFDYRLPLFYPDWELSTLAFIKRIRGGVFADYENVGRGSRAIPRTFGLNVQADMNLLRFYLPNFAIGGTLIFNSDKSSENPIFDFSFSYSF